MATSASFRERLLAEAFAERERILDTVRAQLAEVDTVIASLNGVIPTPELELPTSPQVTDRAAEQAREEKPPTLADEARKLSEEVRSTPSGRASPGVRGRQITQYLEQYGPALRRDIVDALGIRGNTASRAFQRLVDDGEVIKTEGPVGLGGQRHSVYYLPGQDPSPLQNGDAPVEEVKPPSEETRNKGAEKMAELADARDQRIIDFIRENGPTLRAGITKSVGIPKGSWGTVTPRLIEKGLATFEVASTGGKPQVGFMLPGQSIPMGGKMTAAASPVTTKHVDPTSLKPPSEKKPPPPKATAPEKRPIDMGGPERFPEMLRYLPSADKNMPTKSLRAVLDFERKILMALLDGPKLSVVVADELGDRGSQAHKSRVRKFLMVAEETGHAERTGDGYPPWAEGGGNAKGRSSVEYGITDKGRAALKGEPWTGTHPPSSTPTTDQAPSSAPPSSPTEPPTQEPSVSEPSDEPSGLLSGPKLEALRKTKVPSYQDVRDAWVMLPGLMMSPGQLIKELEVNWPIAIVGAFMEQGAAEGKLTDKSPPGGELRIFQYDPPDGPGKAAQIDIDRPPEAPPSAGGGGRRGSPVAGTGSQPVPPHPDAAALVRDIRKAGGEVAPVGSGHWKVVNLESKQSVRISGTPGNPRTSKNDRKRVKRIGLDV